MKPSPWVWRPASTPELSAVPTAVRMPESLTVMSRTVLTVEFEPNHAVFRGGTYVLECDFLMFALGSARAAGGGAMVTPHASTTDGLLDLCVVEKMPRREFAASKT